MKYILSAFFILLALPVNADRVDELKAEGRRAYCQWVTEHVMNGALARLQKKPLVFRIVSEAERKEEDASGEPTPNTINLIDADKWSDQEVRQIEKHITTGWNLMDGYIKSHPELKINEFRTIIGINVQQCLKGEEA